MNNISNYIQEKLIINKNIKSSNTLFDGKNITEKLLIYFGLDNFNDPKLKEVIEDKWEWSKSIKNINELKFAADIESLNDCKLPKEIKKIYDTKPSLNDECQYRLSSAKTIYTNKGIDILYSEDVLAYLGTFGALYCLPEYTL